MIYVGVTGWGDHDLLYSTPEERKHKLSTYAGHFPTVEVDSTFYAIQPVKNFEKWDGETPDHFQFVVKVSREMSGHDREPKTPLIELFERYRVSVDPLKRAGKLRAVLVQLPPWFDVSKPHLDYLRTLRAELSDYEIAIEFRNPTWFSEAFRDRTLQFLTEQRFINTICDEPQTKESSIPFVPVVTHPDDAVVRLHGRNTSGWLKKPGMTSQEWRHVRCLYRYSEEELQELATSLREIDREAKDVYVYFNNNSAGDAAPNAKRLIEILGIEYELAPRQISLF